MVTHRIVNAQSLYCNRRKEFSFVASLLKYLQNQEVKEKLLLASRRIPSPVTPANEQLTREPERNGWITGLLVLSSAALGGIAVALWHRKTLAALRDLEPPGHMAEHEIAEREEFE